MTVDELRGALDQLQFDRAWTYEQLAAAIGLQYVSGQLLRRFIKGERTPRPMALRAIRVFVESQKAAAHA